MASPFPRPDPAGSVSTNVLDAVGELHFVCRRWVESAWSHLPTNFNLATLPYIDLLFAFGFATLGEVARARRLLADAKAVMVTPDKPPVDSEVGSVATIISGLAYRAFEYRVEQAMAGVPLSGPLDGEPLATLDRVRQHAEGKRANNPEFQVVYILERLHQSSRILDPDGVIDCYRHFVSDLNSPLVQSLIELRPHPNLKELADQIGSSFQTPTDSKRSVDTRFLTMHCGLRFSHQAGGTFAGEMLELVREALRDMSGKTTTNEEKRAWYWQVRILERAVHIAANLVAADWARRLTEQFTLLINHIPLHSRLHLINAVGPVCLRSLQVLGLRDEIVKLGEHLRAAIPDSPPNPMNPEETTSFHESRLVLAATRLTVGTNTDVDSILDDARAMLFSGERFKRRSIDFSDLAGAYLFTLGQGTAESGLPRVIELFQKIPPDAVQNAYTTAKYFSRLHLTVAETAVAAVCRMVCEPPL